MIVAADWINPLIAAAAAVFGALVAVIGTIWVALHRDKQAAARERREALVAFYAAANALAHAWTSWNEMQRETGTGTVGSIRLGLRMAGSTNLILTRMFGLTDAFWHSSAHAMSVLDEDAQKMVFAVELAVGEWTFDGTPPPESWGPAIRDLRALIEHRGIQAHPEAEAVA